MSFVMVYIGRNGTVQKSRIKWDHRRKDVLDKGTMVKVERKVWLMEWIGFHHYDLGVDGDYHGCQGIWAEQLGGFVHCDLGYQELCFGGMRLCSSGLGISAEF